MSEQVILTRAEFNKLKQLAIKGMRLEFQLKDWTRKPKTVAQLNKALSKLRSMGKRKSAMFDRLRELAIEALQNEIGLAIGETREETDLMRKESQDEIDQIRKLKRI